MSLEQIQAFLQASEAVRFEGRNREEVYGWVDQTLRQQRFDTLGRASCGLVRRYVEKMTGLSPAQVTRLIGRCLAGQDVKPKRYRRRRFAKRYTRADIELPASVDEAHQTLSGPATQSCCNGPATTLASGDMSAHFRARKQRRNCCTWRCGTWTPQA